MFVKIFIMFFMAVIIYSLGSGLYFLMNDKGSTDKTVKALTWRVGLSLGLFALLFLAFFLGWLTPHGL